MTTYGVYPEPRRGVGQRYEKKGTTVTKYYFAGATRLAALPPELTYFLADRLGSTSISTDSTGVQTAELRYTPWGELRSSSGSMPTDYKFTGQRSEMDTLGLMFYNARWYDPALGRFAAADSLVPGGPQGLDRYAYVNNNPVRYNDPTGHKVCDGAGINGDCDQSVIPGTLGEIIRVLKTYGVNLVGKWSADNAYAAYLGVFMVGEKLQQVANNTGEKAFKEVFEHVDFIWEEKEGLCGNVIAGSGGCTISAHRIKFWSLTGQRQNQLDRMAKNIVHELGHAFYRATGNKLIGDSFSRDALRPDANGRFNWQQHPPSMNDDNQDIPTELFADTFIAWTYNTWNPSPPRSNLLAVDNAKGAINAWIPIP